MGLISRGNNSLHQEITARLMACWLTRIARERGIKAGVGLAWVVCLFILVEGSAARFLLLPDLRWWLAGALLALPLAGALVATLGTRAAAGTKREAARQAGLLAGEESLFLALPGPEGELGPLLRERATKEALGLLLEGLPPPKRGPLQKLLPLPLFLSLLLLLAPGRLREAPLLPPALKRALTDRGRAALRQLPAGALHPGQRSALEQALSRLEKRPANHRETAAIRQALAAAAQAPGMRELEHILQTLKQDPSLAALLAAQDKATRQRLLEALARRLHGPSQSTRKLAQSLLLLARETSQKTLKRQLRASGQALARGSGQDAAAALSKLLKELGQAKRAKQEIKSILVALDQRLQRGPGNGALRGGQAAPALAPQSGPANQPPPAFHARGLETPRREAILRRYFGS